MTDLGNALARYYAMKFLVLMAVVLAIGIGIGAAFFWILLS